MTGLSTELSASVRALIYLGLAAVGFLGVVGDLTINEWARTDRIGWWITAGIIWILAATVFGLVLRWQYFSFGAAVVLALLIHSIAALTADRVLFKTQLSTQSLAGIGFAIVALVLIELGRK